jgi:hypothetical protein
LVVIFGYWNGHGCTVDLVTCFPLILWAWTLPSRVHKVTSLHVEESVWLLLALRGLWLLSLVIWRHLHGHGCRLRLLLHSFNSI